MNAMIGNTREYERDGFLGGFGQEYGYFSKHLYSQETKKQNARKVSMENYINREIEWKLNGFC